MAGAGMRLALLLLAVANVVNAYSPVGGLRSGTSRARVTMRKRYEDAEDKRLSQGGSGGGIGRPNKPGLGGLFGAGGLAYRNTETARFGSADEGQQIRKRKLEAYLDNDLEATDGTFGKIIAGSFLVTLFSLLLGVFLYYGGMEGLMSITEKQRSIRGV